MSDMSDMFLTFDVIDEPVLLLNYSLVMHTVEISLLAQLHVRVLSLTVIKRRKKKYKESFIKPAPNFMALLTVRKDSAHVEAENSVLTPSVVHE